MRIVKLVFVAMIVLCGLTVSAEPPSVVEHAVVFKEEGRFGGWPANNGIWNWGDEIVVGYINGYYKENPRGGHDIDPDRPSVERQARSLDGGLTWSPEIPSYFEDNDVEAEPVKLKKAINFKNPDVALRFRDAKFYYSEDRCRTWNGPYVLPTYGRPGLLARTDYIIEGKRRVTAFVAATKDAGNEGQPLCIRTEDGGRTWDLVGWIGPQPTEGYGYSIMPSTVRIPGDGYLSMIRRGAVFDGEKRWWIEPYLSPDAGASWHLLDEPYINNAGNPASMIRLADGRIAMAYGWRTAPYGMRGMISDDDGQSWSEEFILRADGASWDIGYPRTVQRADGMCVTIYYYHHPDQPERYIAATIWDPGSR